MAVGGATNELEGNKSMSKDPSADINTVLTDFSKAHTEIEPLCTETTLSKSAFSIGGR